MIYGVCDYAFYATAAWYAVEESQRPADVIRMNTDDAASCRIVKDQGTTKPLLFETPVQLAGFGPDRRIC